MKLTKSGESIAGIIIAVFILTFAIFGIMNVVNFNRVVMNKYETSVGGSILKNNSKKIISKIDLTQVKEGEKFYLNRDIQSKEYKVFTGTTNENYKYVDIYGNNINPDAFENKIYTREFIKNIDAIQYKNNPSSIKNLAFHFDSDNIDGFNNTTLSNGSIIKKWQNLNDGTFIKNVNDNNLVSKDEISGKVLVQSLGIGSLSLNTNPNINGEPSCDIEPSFFEEKSFSLSFETGDDITSEQIILKQGNSSVGYSFYILNGEFYASAYNTAGYTKYWCTNKTIYEWLAGNKTYSLNIGKIFPNSHYLVTIVQDSSLKDSENNYIDSGNSFKLYQNGILRGELYGIRPQAEHKNLDIGGDTVGNTRYFKGKIADLISWNYALNETEVNSMYNYLNEKWKGNIQNSEYNNIDTIIQEYK